MVNVVDVGCICAERHGLYAFNHFQEVAVRNTISILGIFACLTFIAGFADKSLPNGLWYYIDLYLPF